MPPRHTCLTSLVLSLCLLSGASRLSAQGSKQAVPMDGWVDLEKPAPDARMLAMTTNGADILVAFSGNARGVEVQLRAADLSLRAKWRLSKYPHNLALTEDAFVTTHLQGETFTACRHLLEGGAEPACVTGEGIPNSVLTAGRRAFAVKERSILELHFDTAQISIAAPDALNSTGPLLTASDGARLVRLDSVGLTASVFDTGLGASQFVRLTSPELAAEDAMKRQGQMLAAHVLARSNGELWLVNGRSNIHTGFTVTRFDRSGRLAGTALLAIPQFAELRRPRAGSPPMGNPTGHMSHDYVVVAGERLVTADGRSGRCAWYGLGRMGGE